MGKKLLIVEGVDNTGKSTTIQRILDKYPNIKYVDCYSPLPPKDGLDYSRFLFETCVNFINGEDYIIMDRFFFSELVYGPIMRKQINITDGVLSDLIRFMEKIKPIILWCNPSIDTILSSFGEREQYPKEENIKPLVDRYRQVLTEQFSDLKVIQYDYTKQYDDLFIMLEEVL